MSVYVRRVMLAVLFMVWAALWVESQIVQAGPLAEAVKKAKAAAGVTDENATPEQVVGQNGVQSALPPTASSKPTQRVEVSTVSVAVRLPITGGRDNAIRAAILRQLDRLQSTSGRAVNWFSNLTQPVMNTPVTATLGDPWNWHDS